LFVFVWVFKCCYGVFFYVTSFAFRNRFSFLLKAILKICWKKGYFELTDLNKIAFVYNTEIAHNFQKIIDLPLLSLIYINMYHWNCFCFEAYYLLSAVKVSIKISLLIMIHMKKKSFYMKCCQSVVELWNFSLYSVLAISSVFANRLCYAFQYVSLNSWDSCN